MSPFSLPPAPPPQLPLPEKPDLARSTASETNAAFGLKRIETEKLLPVNGFSPTKLDSPSSQISNLLNALNTARMEADSKENRVKQLEEQLRQERKARESAEERARHLLDRSKMMFGTPSLVRDDAMSVNNDDTQVVTIETPDDSDGDYPDTTTSNIAEMQKDTEKFDTSASRLQERLNVMLREMEDVKTQMEFHKRRADVAEEERTSLAEMVERIRKGEPKMKHREGSLRKKRSSETATQTDANVMANGSAHTSDYIKQQDHHEAFKDANGAVDKATAQTRQLPDAIATALTIHRDNRAIQSAPYVSILGVVLLGVGLMTYLNSWQKIER